VSESTTPGTRTVREVTIKGVRHGLMLVLPDDLAWEQVLTQLEAKLDAGRALIKGAKAQLDVGGRPLDADALQRLVRGLADSYQMEAIALIGTHETAQAAAVASGIPLTAPTPPTPPSPPERSNVVPTPTDPTTLTNNALYLRQTICSGQSIRHDGNIVICGDVNPGAEVVATGDIIVFGTLRGVAHAGAAGDEGCQIVAINLRPTQIRIAGYIARSPDAVAPPLSKYPEVARVQDSEIHIIPLREMS
jgi:septum site-determining protein MinC